MVSICVLIEGVLLTNKELNVIMANIICTIFIEQVVFDSFRKANFKCFINSLSTVINDVLPR